jgi:hypothetical protein
MKEKKKNNMKIKITPKDKESLYKDISEFPDNLLLINASNAVCVKCGNIFVYINHGCINTCLIEDVCGLYRVFDDKITLENDGDK